MLVVNYMYSGNHFLAYPVFSTREISYANIDPGMRMNRLLNLSSDVSLSENPTNSIFSKTLARIFGYSIWLPNVPAFVLKLVMGEMSVIVLTGRRVSSDKIEQTGFQFQFKNLEEALRNSFNEINLL